MAELDTVDIPTTAPDQGVGYGPIEAIIVAIGSFFAAQFAAAIIILLPLMIIGWDEARISSWLNSSPYASGVTMFLVAAVVYVLLRAYLRHKKTSWNTLGWVQPRSMDAVRAAIGLVVYFFLTIIATTAIKSYFPALDLEQEQQIGFDTFITGLPLLVAFFSLVVVPPLMEEVLFRGFLFTGLRKKFPVIAAALLTSGLFAVAHLQWGSDAPLLWAAAIDTFMLSLVLVYLRTRYNSLWPAIGLHALKNGIAFLALFIFHA